MYASITITVRISKDKYFNYKEPQGKAELDVNWPLSLAGTALDAEGALAELIDLALEDYEEKLKEIANAPAETEPA